MFEHIILPLIGGLIILSLGADRLVHAASRLALALGIPPLIVGLTIVAMGTSAPEVAVSLSAAMEGQGSIALGNVIGSNILNLLLILGISAVIRPIVVQRQLLIWDMPILIGLTGLAWFFSYTDQILTAQEGIILTFLLFPYLTFLYRAARKEKDLPLDELGVLDEGSTLPKPTGVEIIKDLSQLAIGLVALVLGARFFTSGAVALAQFFGVPEWIIGLTVVALGTSLPELATSVVAAFKGASDIAVGNIVGSNIFNILWVLGPAAFLSKTPLVIEQSALSFEWPFLFIISFGALPIFLTGARISRREGLLFLTVFLYYLGTLYLQATQNPFYLKVTDGLGPVFLPIFLIAVLCVAFWSETPFRRTK